MLPPSLLRAGALLVFAAGCAPPPLPGGDSGLSGPSIRFIFPTSSLDAPVCPSFIVAVDIDAFNLVEPDPESPPIASTGHWHLDDDITGDYYPLVAPFTEVTAQLDGQTVRSYRMTASLVNVDHSPLSQNDAPQSIATVEFDVADTPDCIGDGNSTTR